MICAALYVLVGVLIFHIMATVANPPPGARLIVVALWPVYLCAMGVSWVIDEIAKKL